MKKHSSKKSFLRDFSGAFGDTAIFIPLALGMIIICGLSPTAVFLPAGLLYLISGWYYKIPFPVQPLKAVAAISLVNALRPELIATTAYLMSALMLLFLCFDFSKYLDKIFSKPIVRGIQLGLGILLITSAIRLIVKGEIIAGVALPAIEFSGFFWGSSKVSLFLPSLDDIATAFALLLIPQIPLTLGNSMVATADLAKDYFAKRAKKVTYRNLAGTISVGNLLAGLIGGMPVCHGCGGLTAHYRFGARTARANFIIGTTFIALALFFGQVSPYFLREIPLPVFGIALMFVGVFHALLARDMREKNDVTIVVVMGLVTLLYKNLTLALCAGLFLREVLRYKIYYERLCNLLTMIFAQGGRKEISIPYGYKDIEKAIPERQIPDNYSSKIKQLRIAVTAARHLNPLYDVPKPVPQQVSARECLSADEIYQLSRIAVNLGIEKLRITGGEPLLRNDIVKLIQSLTALPDLKELSLATDGILLAHYAHPLQKAGLKKIQVTLDTLKEEKFKAITGGKKLTRIISGIKRAQDAGITVRVNVVVLKGINDDELEDFITFSKTHEVTVRFIEYMPIVLNPQQQHFFMSREEIIEKLSAHLNFKVYPHGKFDNPTKYLSLIKGGETGLISPVNHGLCRNCNRLKLTSDGLLSSCLVQDVQVDLAAPLRNKARDEDIAAIFKSAVLLKPEHGMCVLREKTKGSNL
jgi:molybdenum cofactor biosynthesis protein A